MNATTLTQTQMISLKELGTTAFKGCVFKQAPASVLMDDAQV